MRIRSSAATHVGNVREHNEDRFLGLTGLYAVADGMGGHSAGEVAATIACDELKRRHGVRQAGVDPAIFLRRSMDLANAAIEAAADKDRSKHGMGTTLTAMLLVDGTPGTAIIGHVGDSRCYLVRKRRGSQLTSDHKGGGPHVLSNCLGGRNHYSGADIITHGVLTGDRYVLCSDGLSDYLDAAAVALVSCNTADSRKLPQTLVDEALRAGGADNITVVVIEIG